MGERKNNKCGSSNKFCVCGHTKEQHVKKRGRCKACDCLIYNKKEYV